MQGRGSQRRRRRGPGSPQDDLRTGTANRYLLIAATQSETCLNCHHTRSVTPDTFHVSSVFFPGKGPSQRTPGGDFAYLTKTWTWMADGRTHTSDGERHGHNINAPVFGLEVDGKLTRAPGGSYLARDLHCTSCHDPHGRYRILDSGGKIDITGKPIVQSGSYPDSAPTRETAIGAYRLLAGGGYSPKSLGRSHTFVNDPPAAIAPSTYNRSEASSPTRVAYGSDMSEWCANCHGDFHDEGFSSDFRHPVGNRSDLGPEIAINYATYVASGDLTGSPDSSYLSLVPFELGVGNGAAGRNTMSRLAVSDGSELGGPDSGAKVMCLTCHRAHASGWDSAGRWNFKATFITQDNDGDGRPSYSQEGDANQPDGQGRTETEARGAYYNRPANQFALFQMSLCNKCHAEDALPVTGELPEGLHEPLLQRVPGTTGR